MSVLFMAVFFAAVAWRIDFALFVAAIALLSLTKGDCTW